MADLTEQAIEHLKTSLLNEFDRRFEKAHENPLDRHRLIIDLQHHVDMINELSKFVMLYPRDLSDCLDRLSDELQQEIKHI